jgi:DNA-binding beta-propeller fold protein YncE
VGGGYLFTGNGGTDDVGVVDVQRFLTGSSDAEVHRIPVQTGPFGMAVSPDGKYVVSANRESQRTEIEGNTISIIDVQKAIAKAKDAEVARVLVGTNDPGVKSRPFAAAFIHGGKRVLVSNFRSNNLSVVDVEKAIKGEPAEVARIPLVSPKNLGPSRPRGIAVTADGRYAAITGAPTKKGRGSSVVFVVDLDTLKVVGRVTGVGDEAYFLAVVPDDQL